MKKPTLEQTAWVFQQIRDHILEGGSYRYLIYDRLGFPLESGAYTVLYNSGGMIISNVCNDAADKLNRGSDEEEKEVKDGQ